jgi:hypothetical protein
MCKGEIALLSKSIQIMGKLSGSGRYGFQPHKNLKNAFLLLILSDCDWKRS